MENRKPSRSSIIFLTRKKNFGIVLARRKDQMGFVRSAGMREAVRGAGDLDEEKDAGIRKQIERYVKGYLAALAKGKVEAPGPGDCLYCYARAAQVKKETIDGHTFQVATGISQAGSGSGSGQRLGEAFGDTYHLMEHFRQKYYVPSLLARAIERFPVSEAAKWYLARHWSAQETPQRKEILIRAGEICVDQLQRALRRYLRVQFGFQA
jgi:hypothetical protein